MCTIPTLIIALPVTFLLLQVTRKGPYSPSTILLQRDQRIYTELMQLNQTQKVR